MGNTRYLKLNWLSTFFIFLLFAIGGLVRSTGSGMGCPDWPKCFGEYVPPTSAESLPENYEDFFKDQRIKKTERFTKLLIALGLDEQAEQINSHSNLEEKHSFNVTKAYVEYINRLWGAATGIIVFLCFLASFSFLKKNKRVFVYTLFGFIGVFINALLGAVVVNSNLIGGIVTAHFIAAFASISFFLLARRYAIAHVAPSSDLRLKWISPILLIIVSVQVILGAGVRELYDIMPFPSMLDAKIEHLYPSIHWHAILGAITVCISIYQYLLHGKHGFEGKLIGYVMLLSIGQIIIGPMALLESTAAISKLLHISFGAGIFVLQFYICTSYLKSINQVT